VGTVTIQTEPESVQVFHGRVEGHKISLDRREAFSDLLYRLEDCDITITLGPRRYVRTLHQNAYYHGVICKMIADKSGHTPREVHEALKRHFSVKSTATLSTRAFNLYIERCQALAAEFFDIIIPDPA